MKKNPTHSKQKDNENTVEITTHNLREQDKEMYVLSRWAALFDAIDLIADTAADKNIPFDSLELNPLKIRDYVDSTSDIVMRKLLQEREELNTSLENRAM
jgi:hypothetical protein